MQFGNFFGKKEEVLPPPPPPPPPTLQSQISSFFGKKEEVKLPPPPPPKPTLQTQMSSFFGKKDAIAAPPAAKGRGAANEAPKRRSGTFYDDELDTVSRVRASRHAPVRWSLFIQNELVNSVTAASFDERTAPLPALNSSVRATPLLFMPHRKRWGYHLLCTSCNRCEPAHGPSEPSRILLPALPPQPSSETLLLALRDADPSRLHPPPPLIRITGRPIQIKG
jgi:hypothetical protein